MRSIKFFSKAKMFVHTNDSTPASCVFVRDKYCVGVIACVEVGVRARVSARSRGFLVKRVSRRKFLFEPTGRDLHF